MPIELWGFAVLIGVCLTLLIMLWAKVLTNIIIGK